ncbi:MAG: glycosyl transferase [Chitinophagaceae bacterium]
MIIKTEDTDIKFSVLIATYFKDKSEYLNDALNSLFNQTALPTEIILVMDGPIPNQNQEVINYYLNHDFKILKSIQLENNVGLGNALNYGLKKCNYDVVARMDSDDIALENRFEIQLNYFKNNPDISVLGGWMNEFEKELNDRNKIKSTPVGFSKIIQYAKMRNPLNHPTVMFKKHDVLAVNSYIEINLFEDFYLWLRMLKKGYKLANVKDILVHFRVDDTMISRRHGYKYLVKEIRFITRCYNEKLINFSSLIIQIFTRLPLRLMPLSVLKFIYKYILRNSS